MIIILDKNLTSDQEEMLEKLMRLQQLRNGLSEMVEEMEERWSVNNGEKRIKNGLT